MKIKVKDENIWEIIAEPTMQYKLFILINFLVCIFIFLIISITKIYQIPTVTYLVCFLCAVFYPYREKLIVNKKENLIKITNYSIISYLFKKSNEKEYSLSMCIDNKLKNSKLLHMPFQIKEKEEILNLLENFIK
ncbi:MAG: hypothetical protein E7Z90_01735 [Cyanobacteria bacterium SIG29]|nr:hypothetical protein [Cyanobacteria bacterium SIG29]